jgi:hypothetical protein
MLHTKAFAEIGMDDTGNLIAGLKQALARIETAQ